MADEDVLCRVHDRLAKRVVAVRQPLVALVQLGDKTRGGPPDRTSCCHVSAKQMRLFPHIGAYWLMRSLQATMPRRSSWRAAQFDTLRQRLIKLAARVEVLKRKVRLHLPSSTPNQSIFACALSRLPRMLT